jgi:hypothetical protein
MVDNKSNAQLKLVADSIPENIESQEWKEIRRDRLINSLNRINFRDGEVVINLRHSKYNTFLSLPAKPQPCLDLQFECRWSAPTKFDQKFKNYLFENLYFSDGLKQVQVFVEAKTVAIDQNGIRFTLPETALEINSRKIRRHQCKGISAQISQDGVVLEGKLENFSAVSFSVVINNKSLDFNRASHVSVILKKDSNPLYSGTCDIFRISNKPAGNVITLVPVKSHIQRFESKIYRNNRQEISPAPYTVFMHPITGKRANLKVNDISGVGFSVEENSESSLLVPGMLLPDLNIEFINGTVINCEAQVIYRTIEKLGKIKCGIAILDIDLNDYEKIISILVQAKDNNSFFSPTNIDLDELWDFFFETGFIYPEKYLYLQQKKENFKKLYQKLYCHNSAVAKYVIYKDGGGILGHVSMFRFSSDTWMIHHHAADVTKNIKAGLVVAEHLGVFCNGLSRFSKSKMKYLVCFYRPENRFPSRVFGGVAKSINDPQKCSKDSLAYYLFNKDEKLNHIDKFWEIDQASKDDIIELNIFYEEFSGGLMMHSLDLTINDDLSQLDISEDYEKMGIRRERVVFSLKRKGVLKAIIVVSLSELGLNMSDVTNSINFIVLDQRDFSKDVLNNTLKNLSDKFSQQTVPVLLYPKEFLDEHKIGYKKIYNYLTLDVKYIDNYFVQLEKILHITGKRRRN